MARTATGPRPARHQTRRLILWALVAVCLPLRCTRPGRPLRPHLVVLLVVDQMRADYLSRFRSLFRHGFDRLLGRGALFPYTYLDYAVSETAPGHATIASGVFPSRHGIVGNGWFDRATRQYVHACLDPETVVPGFPGATSCSPARMLRPGIGDWLKARSPASRVFAVSLKRRAGVFLGGIRPDAAFWLDDRFGSFVTSSYYLAQLPEWVERFNRSDAVEDQACRPWELLLPEESYGASREDDFPAELDGFGMTFPYCPHEGGRGPRSGECDRLFSTPFGDDLTLRFAEELIVAERLAEGDADLLLVSLSSADGIGHEFGPMSREVEDYYLRLDRVLGEFLDFLDREAGSDGYLFVLTSDHGVAMLPEEAARQGLSARRVRHADFQAAVAAATDRVAGRLGMPDVLRSVARFDGAVLEIKGASSPPVGRSVLRAALAEELRRLDFIADAYTADELASRSSPRRPYLQEYRRGFFAGRSPDVVLRPPKYWTIDSDSTGASHSTAYPYDIHVPLIFFGAGIPSGSIERRVSSVDIAPTLAALLGIPAPSDLDGESRVGDLLDPVPGHPRARASRHD